MCGAKNHVADNHDQSSDILDSTTAGFSLAPASLRPAQDLAYCGFSKMLTFIELYAL